MQKGSNGVKDGVNSLEELNIRMLKLKAAAFDEILRRDAANKNIAILIDNMTKLQQSLDQKRTYLPGDRLTKQVVANKAGE